MRVDLRGRTIWFLPAILLLAGCTFPGPLESTAQPTPTRASVSLWDAYRWAEAAVRSEAADAQPVSASAQWSTVSPETLLQEPPQWAFVFYSPGRRTVFDLVVDAHQAQVANRSQVWTPPQVLQPGAWQRGPRDALLVFLAYGGQEFLEEHSQAVVSLHLAAEEGKTMWNIATLDWESQETLSILIDAENLEVLLILP